jgi:hypothetical protein
VAIPDFNLGLAMSPSEFVANSWLDRDFMHKGRVPIGEHASHQLHSSCFKKERRHRYSVQS